MSVLNRVISVWLCASLALLFCFPETVFADELQNSSSTAVELSVSDGEASDAIVEEEALDLSLESTDEAGGSVASVLPEDVDQTGSEAVTGCADGAGQDNVEYVYDGAALSSEATQETIAQSDIAASSLKSQSGIVLMSQSEVGISSVQNFSGDTRFDTASMIAKAAYSSADCAVIAADGGWPDALAGASLAGLLDCPILLTSKDGLSPATRSALSDLGTSHVIVLGGPLVISDAVIAGLEGIPGMRVERLAGETRQDTQMMVYEYGKNVPGSSWSGDSVAITSGFRFPDALSFSPLAFRDNVPIFLVDEAGNLNEEQKHALEADGYANPVVLGGPLVMSDASMSFAEELAAAPGNAGGAKRIAGASQYDTSAQIASWLVSSKGFSWDGLAFTTGNLPYDALTGSVLQGSEGSVILVVDHSWDAGVSSAASNKGSISRIKFFGGTLAIPMQLRSEILELFGDKVSFTKLSLSFDEMLQLEQNYIDRVNWSSSTEKENNLAQLPTYLNPSSYSLGDDEFYQFAILSDGYSGIPASILNQFIATNGSNGKLAGQGQAFIDAANMYGVNEVYLLSHAVLESSWGNSQLAMGYYYDGKTKVNGKYYPEGTYYNFFGIGAVDSGPLSGGRAMAIMEGWDSPYDAILGAAKWIDEQYLNNGYGPQNTLYRMKWDLHHAELGQQVWKQYASAVHWATGIASVMANCYEFAENTNLSSGLRYEVPVFAEA